MRTFYKYIIAIFILLIISNSLQSQVVDVCADSDSIFLRVGNYQYGTIEWESSYDNENWTKINGAKDTTYKFLPAKTKYYRAVVKFAKCPLIYSETSFVQMSSKANAGSNRIVSGNSLTMMANLQDGETGNWSIINGDNGSFTAADNPYSEFSGSNSAYSLVWTVTNACGTSKDTINVEFRENDYIEPLVVVDETDVILSTATQIEDGEYIIEFSSPVPQITNSTILIGLINDGFLRKVNSFTQNGNILTMQTEQSSLDKITINGAYDVAQVFNIDTNLTGNKASSNYRKLDYMPTRAELKKDPKFKIANYYYVVNDESIYTYPGVSLKKSNTKSGNALVNLNFNKTILSTGNVNLELNGNYSFNPNLKAELDYLGLQLNSFNMGMYNGSIERNYELSLTASGSANLIDKEFTLLSLKKDIVFVIGAVPVWVRSEFKIDGQVSADISASMNITHEYNKTSVYTAAIEYQQGQWNYIYNEKDNVETVNSYTVNGDLTQTFDIGPNITFKIFGIVGPYINTSLTEELNLCAYNSNWQANIDIGGELTVGAEAKILGSTLFDISKTWSQGFYHLQMPYHIEIYSGNNQNYTLGDPLNKPVKVKVTSNKGFAIPGAIVHLNPINGGSVANNTLVTDDYGIVEISWTPGGNEQSQLEAFMLDCDGNHINNSPIVFNSYAGQTNCAESSLSVSIIENESTISPLASMGVPPYTYSTDGINFSSIIPEITLETSQTYEFSVKDNAGCMASVSYVAPSDACQDSDLTLNLTVLENDVEANAANGMPPYQYAIDNLAGNYSSDNTFSNLSESTHIIYVQDANGCTAQATAYVTGSGNSGSLVTDIDGNVYNTVVIGDQVWMAENLKTTHYADGTAIPLVINTEWGSLNSPAYCYYNNDASNTDTYGALYNWYTVSTEKLCPTDWHVPTDTEWKTLEILLGMTQGQADEWGVIGRGTNQGSKLAGNTSLWNSGLLENNDEFGQSGFMGLPGGFIHPNGGIFYSLGYSGYWWTSTESDNSSAYYRSIKYDKTTVFRHKPLKREGQSVRCIRDSE